METDPFAALAPFLELGRDAVFSAFAVFLRVGAAVALLPGFGENALPMRVKLGGALAFAVIVWPAVSPLARLAGAGAAELALTFAAEAVAGALIGLSARLLVMALQTAGSVAAQSTSIAQMFGEGLTADPQPAYANVLAVAGIALAFALGLPGYAAAAIVESYALIPFGGFALGEDVASWGVARVAAAFALAMSIALPFVIASFAYNLALGAINKAMPQLMVAFVGAPAITAGALLLMGLVTPAALDAWGVEFARTLAGPLEAP